MVATSEQALRIFFRAVMQIHACGELCEDGRLWLRASKRTVPAGVDIEVSVAYFRAGYAPADYPSEAEWAARLLIEQSLAVKVSITGVVHVWR